MVVRYATHGMSSQLFVSKYQLYLPNETELRLQLEYILQLPDDNTSKLEDPLSN